MHGRIFVPWIEGWKTRVLMSYVILHMAKYNFFKFISAITYFISSVSIDSSWSTRIMRNPTFSTLRLKSMHDLT